MRKINDNCNYYYSFYVVFVFNTSELLCCILVVLVVYKEKILRFSFAVLFEGRDIEPNGKYSSM